MTATSVIVWYVWHHRGHPYELAGFVLVVLAIFFVLRLIYVRSHLRCPRCGLELPGAAVGQIPLEAEACAACGLTADERG